MSEQNHPWCRDVARDEAVRRAEDAAAVPEIQHRDLPAAVDELWQKVSDLEHEAEVDRRVGAGCHYQVCDRLLALEQGDDLPALAALRERVARLEQTQAVPSPPPVYWSNVREGEPSQPAPVPPAEGLRTERVTLEITHRRHTAHEWAWPQMTWVDAIRGESVRVVDECCLDRINMGEVIRQRDAARRERDEARAQCERLSASLMKAAQERDRAHEARGRIRSEWEKRGKALHIAYGNIAALKARVAELDGERERMRGALTACDVIANSNTTKSLSVNRCILPEYDCPAVQCVIAAVEREIALRASVSELDRALHAAGAEAAMLRGRVEVLEYASNPAKAANAGGDANVEHWMGEMREGILALEHMIYVFRENQSPSVQSRMEKLRRLVEVWRDHARPILAANAGGQSNQEPPRGWLTKEERDAVRQIRDYLVEASELTYRDIVTLDALLARSSPPEPRGWLTAKEREAVQVLVGAITPSGGNIYRDEIATLRALLARETPPRVKVPPIFNAKEHNAVVAAIREAGGEVE